MITLLRRICGSTLAAGFLLFLSATARAFHQDPSSWNAIYLQGPFRENSPWGLFAEIQTRVGKTASSSNRFLARGALRYEMAPGLFAFAGYAWTPNLSPFRDENRLWQQLQWNTKLSSTTLILRFRQEQRFIEFTSGPSHRSRFMLRTVIPASSSLNVVLWDECFFVLNSVSSGPSSGFDQNRIFIGINIPFDNGRIVFEPGYLNVFNKYQTQQDLMQHVIGTFFYFNL